MILIQNLIQELNKLINEYEQRHINEAKYKLAQQEFIAKLREYISADMNSIIKRECLITFLNQSNSISLIYNGLWKLRNNLHSVVKQKTYSERLLYLDEITDLHDKVAGLYKSLTTVSN